MNKSRFFLTALVALLLVTSFSFAGEDHDGKHHKMKIKIAGDGAGVESFDIGELEVGETHQLFTEEGKEVNITRDEDGYTVNVDGKDIDIHTGGHHTGSHHGASFIAVDGDEGHKVKVITKTMSFSDDGEESENVFVFAGDGEEGEHGEHAFVWVSDDENAKGHDMSFMIKKQDVLGHVLESKALDGLDEATRQRIIEAIKEGEQASRPHRIHGTKTIVIKSDEDGEDH